MGVTAEFSTYCLNKNLKLFCPVSHIRPVTARPIPPLTNIRSTLRTDPEICKNVSVALIFGFNGNSCTVSIQSDVCVCMHIHVIHNKETMDW